MFARVCGRKYFFKFTMFAGGRTEPPLLVHLFILKNLFCVFKDTRAKGLRRFKIFLGVTLVNTFVFTFASCIQFVFTFMLTRACVRCVRRVRARRWRCGARAVRCLPTCVRRWVHVLRCPWKNAKNLEARGQNCTPHPEKKVVSVAGAVAQNRYIAPTL